MILPEGNYRLTTPGGGQCLSLYRLLSELSFYLRIGGKSPVYSIEYLTPMGPRALTVAETACLWENVVIGARAEMAANQAG